MQQQKNAANETKNVRATVFVEAVAISNHYNELIIYLSKLL